MTLGTCPLSIFCSRGTPPVEPTNPESSSGSNVIPGRARPGLTGLRPHNTHFVPRNDTSRSAISSCGRARPRRADLRNENAGSPTSFKRAFTSFKTGVKHKHLLRKGGGACSLPGVGGGVRCRFRQRTRETRMPALFRVDSRYPM